MNQKYYLPTPSKWDLRFLELAKLVATWSRDPSTQVGAVIVRPDKTICSVGFNGFPKKMLDAEYLYNNRDEKYGRIIHGEMNALLHTNEKVTGYTLYTWPFLPCERCVVHMAQAGITTVVSYICPQEKEDRWAQSLFNTRLYCFEMGINLIEYDNHT